MAETRPLVYACAGNSPEARLAEEVAAGLERLGLAEMSSVVAVAANVPSLLRTARSRGPVVAIDGCRRRCCATLLRSKGIRVSHAVRLDELAAGDDLVELVAAKLGLPAPRPRGRATSRYLRPLLELDPHPATAATVARSVGVTRPSAREVLEGLRRRGLVDRRPDKTYALTAAGADAARQAVRRQRIVECFLADFVGYPPAAVRELAQPIAEALSQDAAERLFDLLGAPARCPHGEPIEPTPAPGPGSQPTRSSRRPRGSAR